MTTTDIRKAFGIGSCQPPVELKTEEEILDCIRSCVTLIANFDDIYLDGEEEQG